MATHSSTLAWKIPWTEEPGRLQSMSLRVGDNWATSLSLFTFMHWRRKWHPTPVFLPAESQGQRSLVGCRLWGRRVGHGWSDLAAAAARMVNLVPTSPSILWPILSSFIPNLYDFRIIISLYLVSFLVIPWLYLVGILFHIYSDPWTIKISISLCPNLSI